MPPLTTIPHALYSGRIVIDVLSHFPPFQADSAYADVWQFPSVEVGQRAFREWDPATTPEPDGWDRHPRTLRRRPGRDASQEEVRE